MAELYGSDAFSPREIAQKVDSVGVQKARLPLLQTALLGVLAGAFIGLGSLYYTLVVSDTSLGFAAARVLGGVVFSLGLLLVVVAGAELFTGNNLLAMAWAERKISTAEVLRNWAVVCVTNFIGAAGLALLVWLSGHAAMNDGAVARTALAGRSVIDKAMAIVLPISAFVAAGFEHSVANMYFIPLGMLLQPAGGALGWAGLAHNLAPVVAGNLVGGSVLVALVYWVVYLRAPRSGG
jgi:formate/nitrite transporter FocA (FNT family)